MSRMRFETRILCLSLAATLPLAWSSGAHATDGPAPVAAEPQAAQLPVEELQVLDEIWVRGKHLSSEVVRAEDDFYRLYNKLNRNSDYDVSCGYMRLDRRSMIMQRTCVPGFLVDHMVTIGFGGTAAAQWFGGASTAPCNRMSAVNDIGGGTTTYYTADCGSFIAQVGSPFGYTTYQYNRYDGISSLLLAAHRQDLADNILKVAHSDPVLLEKATRLARLYQEMKKVQARYVEVKTAEGPGQKPGSMQKTGNPNNR